MALQSMEAFANITLQELTASVAFSNIPQSYRDLVLAVSGRTDAASGNLIIRPNNDTGPNYSMVRIFGTGSAAGQSVSTAENYVYSGNLRNDANGIIQATSFDYSSTDRHKTFLVRHDLVTETTMAVANRWASTSAISSFVFSLSSGSFSVGTTFSLYGRIG
jgi:hypothetical protein